MAETNDAKYNEAMPFPKMGQLDYKDRRQRTMTEKQKIKRPTSIKSMIKNLGLKLEDN